MEIKLDKRDYCCDLIIKADNVHIVEDIEERIYGKTEQGTTDYRNVKRDIKTEAIEQFVSILDDMIYFRQAEFDSSGLIERLFEKLSQDKVEELLEKLNKQYIG